MLVGEREEMSIIDDEPMPKANLSRIEFEGLPRDGAYTYDPVEKAYVTTRTTRSWFRTEDSIVKGACTILREVAAIWLERVWYQPQPDGSFVCVRGERISLGFRMVCQEVCLREQELVSGRRWEEPMNETGSEARQHFRYVKPDGDPPDDIWITE
jgi:hypothetical protein